MGSLGTGAYVTDVTYHNVYTCSSNNMFLIKSNGGDGTVANVVLERFIGTHYPLIDHTEETGYCL